MQLVEDILHFWFGDLQTDDQISEAKHRIWFNKNDEIDQACSRFEAELLKVAQGDTETWKTSPRGILALIILLDQFSRNIYRNSPKAFAQDPQALALSLKAVETGVDAALRPIERIFLYMPQMHSEKLAHQKQSIRLFENLLETAPLNLKEIMKASLDAAHRHCEIIERFDRFPHRNEILARPNTPEEEAFLTQPGYRF